MGWEGRMHYHHHPFSHTSLCQRRRERSPHYSSFSSVWVWWGCVSCLHLLSSPPHYFCILELSFSSGGRDECLLTNAPMQLRSKRGRRRESLGKQARCNRKYFSLYQNLSLNSSKTCIINSQERGCDKRWRDSLFSHLPNVPSEKEHHALSSHVMHNAHYDLVVITCLEKKSCILG